MVVGVVVVVASARCAQKQRHEVSSRERTRREGCGKSEGDCGKREED